MHPRATLTSACPLSSMKVPAPASLMLRRLRLWAGLGITLPLAAWAQPLEATRALPGWLWGSATLGGLGGMTLLWRLIRQRSTSDKALVETMLDHAPQFLVLITPDGRVIRGNRTARRWMQEAKLEQTPRHAALNAPLWRHPMWGQDGQQGERLRLAMAQAAGGRIVKLELNSLDDRGAPRTMEMTVRPVAALPGQPRGHLLIEAQDVTTRRHAEEKLRLAAAVYEQTREGVLIADLRGVILSVNPAFCEITAFQPEELQGQSIQILSPLLHDTALPHTMQDEVQRTGHWQGEVMSMRRNGAPLTAWVSMSLRRDADQRGGHLIAIVHDVTSVRQVEQKLLRRDHFDGLTDLPNRQLLVDRMTQAMAQARRHQQPLALLFLDVNQLRHVNDNFGHTAGDGILREVAQRLRQSLREVDTVARLGGDEFAVLLPGATAEGASQVADKLIERLAQPCHVEGHEFSLTFSIGVALSPDDADTPEALLRCADTAMYRAKLEGRGRWCFYSADMVNRSARQLQLEAALRRAEERNELALVYQPQLCLQSGRLVGMEALIRWKHPELGMISPAEFIPLAESSGQILSIGAWVMRTAVRQMKQWIDDGQPANVVAVNLSAVQFRDPGLPELVQKVLDDAGLPPSCLELELTESVAAHNPAEACEIMDRLHALGVRLSIDDFGTGFSSLSHLKRFPIHTLKIDQSFVRDIGTDPDDRAIVQAIIQMARALRLTTIAEGVETDEQAAFLQSHGCEAAQGYRFCKPLPPEDALAWVQNHTRPNSAARALITPAPIQA